MVRFATNWMMAVTGGLCLLVAPFLFAQSIFAQNQSEKTESRIISRSPGSIDPGVDRQSDVRENVGFDQKLGEAVPLEDKWLDDTGDAHTLGEILKSGRPVLLVPAYFQCKLICNKVLNGVFDSLKLSSFQPGRDFELVVFSFDDREGPEQARAKKIQMMEAVGRLRSVSGWHFWTGSKESIDKLTKSIGYRFAFEPKLDEYQHATGIVAITPNGLVSRYLMGINFPATQVQLALSEASGNRIGTLVDQVKMLCFTYDPSSGKYTLVVMRVVQGGAILTLVALFTFMGWNWIRGLIFRSSNITNGVSPGAMPKTITVTPGAPTP